MSGTQESKAMWSGVIFVFVFVGTIATLLCVGKMNVDRTKANCAAACGSDVVVESCASSCQCAEPGKDGKVYYVKPEGKP